jgi:hypothetical protein
MSSVIAFAVGTGDSTPPPPTETTQDCAEGLIFDLATQICMTPDQSTNDDSTMMDAVRELADDGRYADALIILDRLNPDDSMVQTYYGFTPASWAISTPAWPITRRRWRLTPTTSWRGPAWGKAWLNVVIWSAHGCNCRKFAPATVARHGPKLPCGWRLNAGLANPTRSPVLRRFHQSGTCHALPRQM